MKISLIVPPVVYARQAPINVAYLASYLKHKGYQVQSLDLSVELSIPNDCDDEFWRQKENCISFFEKNKNLFDEWIVKILKFSPRVIGFCIWESNEYFALRLAELIKKQDPNILIVFGGPHCSYGGKNLISEPIVDIVVYGEGEETLFDIIKTYTEEHKVEYSNGCLFKKDGKIIDYGPRSEIENLDRLPFPDFSGFQIGKYMHDFIPISFSRGCAWRCPYCSTAIRWKKIRLRSPENIYEEIKYRLGHKDTLRFQEFQICDPALNQSLIAISKLSDLIIADGLKVRFHGFAQIKPEMDFEMINKMKKAGFATFDYGVESGSQKVLNNMGRNYSIELAEQVIKNTYNAGIKVILNFIVGYPNETEEDFYETLKFIKNIKGYVTNIGPGHPCEIAYSYIYFHPEEFNIVIPKDASFSNWITKDGKNTLEERNRRAKIFNSFLRSLNIPNLSPAEDREKFMIESSNNY